MSECPACGCDPCVENARCRYPYTHDGPAVFGDKMTDFMISELALREDREEAATLSPKERRRLAENAARFRKAKLLAEKQACCSHVFKSTPWPSGYLECKKCGATCSAD